MTILAADKYTTNSNLMVACRDLGYIRPDDYVLDPTFGRGTWWKGWVPEHFFAHTREPGAVEYDFDLFRDQEFDFRAMPWEDDSFDVVAFDPPYVSIGGRTTTGTPDMHAHYGMTDAPTTPAGVQQLIDDGLDECNRVSRRLVLVKCQSYVSSGKFFPGEYLTWTHADSIGMTCVDRFIHVTSPRPQPPRARQVHARNNCSVLFVFGVSK